MFSIAAASTDLKKISWKCNLKHLTLMIIVCHKGFDVHSQASQKRRWIQNKTLKKKKKNNRFGDKCVVFTRYEEWEHALFTGPLKAVGWGVNLLGNIIWNLSYYIRFERFCFCEMFSQFWDIIPNFENWCFLPFKQHGLLLVLLLVEFISTQSPLGIRALW